MVNANEGGHKKQKKEKQTKSRVGQEFKAKVSFLHHLHNERED